MIDIQEIKIAAAFLSQTERASDLFAVLDVLIRFFFSKLQLFLIDYSFAQVATKSVNIYVRPTLLQMGVGDTVLLQSRHPCLECQDNINFIPNDVELKRGL